MKEHYNQAQSTVFPLITIHRDGIIFHWLELWCFLQPLRTNMFNWSRKYIYVNLRTVKLYSHQALALTLALLPASMLERNSLLPMMAFTPSVNISISGSVSINTGNAWNGSGVHLISDTAALRSVWIDPYSSTSAVCKSTGTCREVNKPLMSFEFQSLLPRRTFGTTHLSTTYWDPRLFMF